MPTNDLARQAVYTELATLLEEEGHSQVQLHDDLTIKESGVDSLAFAVLVVRLEDRLGVDPLASLDTWPQTLGQLVNVYQDAICSN